MSFIFPSPEKQGELPSRDRAGATYWMLPSSRKPASVLDDPGIRSRWPLCSRIVIPAPVI